MRSQLIEAEDTVKFSRRLSNYMIGSQYSILKEGSGGGGGSGVDMSVFQDTSEYN